MTDQAGLHRHSVEADASAAEFAVLLAIISVVIVGATVILGDTIFSSLDFLTASAANAFFAMNTELVFADGNTVTIDASPIGGDNKTYTFRTGPTLSVANEVLIGASSLQSLENLEVAITAGVGSGTRYAASTVAHNSVVTGGVTLPTFAGGNFELMVLHGLGGGEDPLEGDLIAVSEVGSGSWIGRSGGSTVVTLTGGTSIALGAS